MTSRPSQRPIAEARHRNPGPRPDHRGRAARGANDAASPARPAAPRPSSRSSSWRRGSRTARPAYSSPSKSRPRTSARTCWASAGTSSGGRAKGSGRSSMPRRSPTRSVVAGAYDLGALMARIESAVKKVGATRVSLDSLGAIFTQFSDAAVVRRELFRIATALKKLGVTSVMTAERKEEYGEISRFGVEEFVADNVIILRNILEDEKRRRTIETLKFRGTAAPKRRVSVHGDPRRRHHRDPAVGHRAQAALDQHPHHVGQRRARQDVRRRFLPRLDHPRHRGHRLRQDPDVHRVHRRRRRPRGALRACSRSRRAASSCSETRPAGASTSSRWSATACSRSCALYPEVDGPRRPADPDEEGDRRVQARPARRGQPLRARARLDPQRLPRVRHRARRRSSSTRRSAVCSPRPRRRCWAAPRSPRRTSPRSPIPSSCCATWRCSARCAAASRCSRCAARCTTRRSASSRSTARACTLASRSGTSPASCPGFPQQVAASRS